MWGGGGKSNEKWHGQEVRKRVEQPGRGSARRKGEAGLGGEENWGHKVAGLCVFVGGSGRRHTVPYQGFCVGANKWCAGALWGTGRGGHTIHSYRQQAVLPL